MPARLRPPRLVPALLAAAFTLGALACGSGSGATPTSTVATTPGPAGTPGPIALTILAPEAGATVTNPFTLRVQATGIQIAAASAAAPGAAHFDAFLDRDPIAEGKLIPSGTGIFHFTDSVELRAPPGQHTIVVALSGNDHVRLKGAPTAEVTVNVQ